MQRLLVFLLCVCSLIRHVSVSQWVQQTAHQWEEDICRTDSKLRDGQRIHFLGGSEAWPGSAATDVVSRVRLPRAIRCWHALIGERLLTLVTEGQPVSARVSPGPRGRLDAGLGCLCRRPIKSMGLGQDTKGLQGRVGGGAHHAPR